MSWGDGVPTYADELAQRLSEIRKLSDEKTRAVEGLADRLGEARTAWRVLRDMPGVQCNRSTMWYVALDRALEIL